MSRASAEVLMRRTSFWSGVDGGQEFRGWPRKEGTGLGQGVGRCRGLEAVGENQCGRGYYAAVF